MQFCTSAIHVLKQVKDVLLHAYIICLVDISLWHEPITLTRTQIIPVLQSIFCILVYVSYFKFLPEVTLV